MSIEKINKANRKISTISIAYDPNLEDNDLDALKNGVGITPMFFYKGLEINISSITEFNLSNSKFLPTLEIIFADVTNLMSDELFPEKSEILTCFIRSNTKLKKDILIDFGIDEVVQITSDINSSTLFKINATMHINELYSSTISNFKGTSYDFMDMFTRTAHLGFMSNVKNTKDSMNWLNLYDTNIEFLKDVIKHSYINENTFVWSYIDFYYNLVYIDIEKQRNENISEQTESSNFEHIVKKPLITKLKLSNNPGLKGSDMHISNYRVINQARETEISGGDIHVLSYYNKTTNNYVIKDAVIIDKTTDDITTKTKEKRVSYLGKIDTDNVHENYPLSYLHNTLNLDFLQQVKIIVILDTPNFNLYRFQKVSVELFKNNNIYEKPVEAKGLTVEEAESNKVNKRFSCDWLITAISYKFNTRNSLYQEVTLVRKKLNTT